VRTSLQRFVLALLQGIWQKKHGRSGYPHDRLVWLDTSAEELGIRYGKSMDDLQV
jgi:hypothetical protein